MLEKEGVKIEAISDRNCPAHKCISSKIKKN
jgi:hypothetical protein